MTALTNQQKSQIRREELNLLAKALGYPSWRKFETAMKNKFTAGERIDISWKPASGSLRPA